MLSVYVQKLKNIDSWLVTEDSGSHYNFTMEHNPCPFSLNTYKIPPQNSSHISKLEKLSKERICLYKIMEEAKIVNLRPNTRKWDAFMESQIRKEKLDTYDILLNETSYVGIAQARLDDHIAHWILSLCYCRTNEFRSCFINWELQWFILLYRRMSQSNLKEFLMENEFVYAPVSFTEKEALKDKLLGCRNLTTAKFESISYYKADFTEIKQLVASKHVFIQKGIAYFPECDIIHCIKNRLCAQFSIHLQCINKMLPILSKEDPINFLIQDISILTPAEYRQYSVDYICFENTPDINLENIDEFANNHYPLCMKTIHKALRVDHHLKYDGKMQYGIFLKWIGLSYEDAEEFWKNEFTQSMSKDLYARKYAYLFKHQYGRVGGKIQYKPYTCEKIQRYSPLPGQYHGCPFKHWDKETLLKRLKLDGLRKNDMNLIEEQVDRAKYQDACTRYFCSKYQVFRDDVIQSPVQFAFESFHISTGSDNVLNTICGDLSS